MASGRETSSTTARDRVSRDGAVKDRAVRPEDDGWLERLVGCDCRDEGCRLCCCCDDEEWLLPAAAMAEARTAAADRVRFGGIAFDNAGSSSRFFTLEE